jgi:hypothetical protein
MVIQYLPSSSGLVPCSSRSRPWRRWRTRWPLEQLCSWLEQPADGAGTGSAQRMNGGEAEEPKDSCKWSRAVRQSASRSKRPQGFWIRLNPGLRGGAILATHILPRPCLLLSLHVGPGANLWWFSQNWAQHSTLNPEDAPSSCPLPVF